MLKCKYAGDPEDEYCKSCDGISMIVDGKESSCSECAGYEAGEDVKEEEFSMPEPVEDKPVKEEPKKKSTKSNKKNVENTPETVSNVVKDTNIQEPTETLENKENSSVSIGSVTMLRYMSGATICHNETYYKFECCEERKLPEDLTEEQVQDEREKLWAHLNAEVDRQIADVING